MENSYQHMEQGTEKPDGAAWKTIPALVPKLAVTESSPATSIPTGSQVEQGAQWSPLDEYLGWAG